MRCGLTFRLARTHPARARSSGSETLSRSRSLVGYTIDTHESEVFGSHRNTELVGIGQDALSHDASPVQGILKLADGSLERVAAPWLISAEGAHSLVRTTLDLPFEGHTREEQYALGDLPLAGDLPSRHIQLFSADHGCMALF